MDSEEQKKQIAELQTHQAVLDVKLDNIVQSINEIKVNHLVHINDQLTILNKGMVDMGILINTKINEVYAKITDLKISDAKQEPTTSIIQKIIEFVIIAIIGAGLALLIDKK